MKRPIRFIVDYLVLSFFVSAAIVLTLIFNGNRVYQRSTIIALALIYIVWGALHHQKEGTLHPKVMLEYLLFGILGTILVIGLF